MKHPAFKLKPVRTHPWLAVLRSTWLALEISLAFGRALLAIVHPSKVFLRTRWMQATARRLLAVFGVRLFVDGAVPQSGLVVSNHLSYLDILVLGAVMPAIFVSKDEVRFWPVFGQLAQLAGTIFVKRERKLAVGKVGASITSHLQNGSPVVLFPEGTSTDGSSVAPFRSALLNVADHPSSPVTLACLHYATTMGNSGAGVSYCRDMVFLPHLFNLLGIRAIQAFICFEPASQESGRKQRAHAWHQQLLAIKGDANRLHLDHVSIPN